jgi:pimeloyl-ACP methyl ester carboxylesterase
MAIKSSSVRRKSQTLAWRRSTSSTKKVATVHLRWWSLSAMAAAVMAAEAAVMVGGATLVGAAEAAITGVVVTAAEVAVMDAVAAVASASFLVAAAVAAVVAAEAIGAGSMGCEPGALILMAISFANRRRDRELVSVRLVLATSNIQNFAS